MFNEKNFLEIELPDPSKFLVIKETLTRMGVASREKKRLYQSCHILHKRGKYYIVHFKQMFELDGLETNIDETDYGRRNAIATTIENWGLCRIINKPIMTDGASRFFVISFKDKSDWTLIPKYSFDKTHLYEDSTTFEDDDDGAPQISEFD